MEADSEDNRTYLRYLHSLVLVADFQIQDIASPIRYFSLSKDKFM